MRSLVIFAFALAVSLAVMDEVSASPDVTSVTINPNAIDNQVDEQVSFQAECSICSEEGGLQYFYWNTSVNEATLKEGTSFAELNFDRSSTEFTKGEHQITLQVQDDNGQWSDKDDPDATTTLSVDGKDGGSGSITVNFQIDPPMVSLGQTAAFRACKDIQPDPLPCVDDPNAVLQFDWDIMLEGESVWTDLGNYQSFEEDDFVVGDHMVRLIITNEDGESSDGTDTLEFIVNPPIPIALIVNGPDFVLKAGQDLSIQGNCYDRFMVEDDNCGYFWELREADGNALVSEFATKEIKLTGLTQQTYALKLRTQDANATYSTWVQAMVVVGPSNVLPSAMITITPDPVGSLMASEYYKLMNVSFSSHTSSDSDGVIISYEWYISQEGAWILSSTEPVWTTTFNETGNKYIRLVVIDNDGASSLPNQVGIKIIQNNPPTIELDISPGFDSEGNAIYYLNSTVKDEEGTVVSFNWTANGELVSEKQNATWVPKSSGEYIIKLEVVDNGGAVNQSTETITVSVAESKNFMATFSSKDIEVGESVTIDFSGTNGSVNYYEIIVTDRNSVSDPVKYKTTENKFVVKFDEAGEYNMDVYVYWADGIPTNGDWYGPTIIVGGGAPENSGEAENVDDLSSDELPSISIVLALLVISLMASRRRQR